MSDESGQGEPGREACDTGPTFRCPACSTVGHLRDDCANGYCGKRDWFSAISGLGRGFPGPFILSESVSGLYSSRVPLGVLGQHGATNRTLNAFRRHGLFFVEELQALLDDIAATWPRGRSSTLWQKLNARDIGPATLDNAKAALTAWRATSTRPQRRT